MTREQFGTALLVLIFLAYLAVIFIAGQSRRGHIRRKDDTTP